MIWHDLVCDKCSIGLRDVDVQGKDSLIHVKIENGLPLVCGTLQISYGSLSRNAQCDSRDRAVVWYHPQHGYRYPGRNDVPMPKAYAKAGFERKELMNIQDVKQLEKNGKVLSEMLHYDKGTGHDFLGN